MANTQNNLHLAGTPSYELKYFVGSKFTAHMALLTANRAFGLGRRHYSSPWCYVCTAPPCHLKLHLVFASSVNLLQLHEIKNSKLSCFYLKLPTLKYSRHRGDMIETWTTL